MNLVKPNAGIVSVGFRFAQHQPTKHQGFQEFCQSISLYPLPCYNSAINVSYSALSAIALP
ncbi:MAG: hypothetical protein HC881_05985 [Leptolyngbyaceae cyanobacterium SL_7_1]|nr:hypothetical protein [Leptolyngbyaceae cyanobacterium SL_7_1]